jgi:tRNA(Ile)-lysidine synthase
LVERVCEKLNEASGVGSDVPWLLAASGGRDSTVLAYLLWYAKIPFAMAHMNYGLRAAESDRDEQFVRDLAMKMNVQVYVQSVDAAGMKGNRQAVCRRLRYDWMQKLCVEQNFRGILTGHHSADQAETVLMALLKGRGLRARAGMDFKVGLVYRPLLNTSTEEIEEYAATFKIGYVVDSSNQSLRYDRNYIRHVLGPLLTERFPDWQQQLLSSASDCRLASNRVKQTAQAESHRIVAEQTPDFMRWAVIDSVHSSIYLEIARQFIPNRHSLVRLCDLLAGAPHRQLTTGDWLITRTGHELIWEKTNLATADTDNQHINRETYNIEFKSPGIYTLSQEEQLVYRVWANAQERSNDIDEGGTRWVEASWHSPCIFRYWKAGDRIRMEGSGGRKKVSDLLNESAVPPVRRRRTLVMVQGDEILWVLGYRSVSFAGSPEEYPRQAFRLCSLPKQDSSSITNNPQD